MNIKPNPDKEFFTMAKECLKNNEGYCPCALEKLPEYKCPCEEFRQTTEEGLCYCGLLTKTNE